MVSVHHIAAGFYSLLHEYVLVFVCVCTCTLAFDSRVSKHKFKYRLDLFKNYKGVIKIYIFLRRLSKTLVQSRMNNSQIKYSYMLEIYSESHSINV